MLSDFLEYLIMENQPISAHDEAMNAAIKQLLVAAGQTYDESRNYSAEHTADTLSPSERGVAQMAAVLLIRRNDKVATDGSKKMQKFM